MRLNIASEPGSMRLTIGIDANPLPRGFLPKADSGHAKEFVYPSEDAALTRCTTVPEVERLFYGVLIREGLRVSEALNLTWSALDLEHGVISLDENKTDDPRDWSLDPGVCRALQVWKSLGPKARRAGAKVFVRPDGRVLDRYEAAARLRDCLREAGVTREQLFVRSDTRLALRAHDLRASFVTVETDPKSEHALKTPDRMPWLRAALPLALKIVAEGPWHEISHLMGDMSDSELLNTVQISDIKPLLVAFDARVKAIAPTAPRYRWDHAISRAAASIGTLLPRVDPGTRDWMFEMLTRWAASPTSNDAAREVARDFREAP
jgi:hypothetical protein